ncbi:tetrapyrrole methylase family protein / MazG family protein [Geosporobacter subterraneus DSM 17957]|uniref:Tetrapyrrole methylase family protein / MazG family protein n=1 Tax=Geosporobacter subterraneus DSM 17957 TaxID=1121919 RepID=A0A1M6FFZ9_9FIRM|nr:nucleoside triphosphate pyrophosphohydrolase [Geosporobacter subterraneus]SHI96563.1 tetrapyrrole methylase family protein / MazG family protein [Geosporobacter subterraneus DSM 17957]
MQYQLTILGLGPGSMDYITTKALNRLKEGKKILLRTQKHPVVEDLKAMGIQMESFDHLYEEAADFDQVYGKIVDRIFQMLKEGDLIYAVPGSPFVAEHSVQMLIQRAEEMGAAIDFVPGISFIEAVLNALKKDPVQGLQIVDGLQLDSQIPNSDEDVLITQVYSRAVASGIKLNLMNYYPDETPITIIRGAGIPKIEHIEYCRLHEMDHFDWIDYLTSVYIPKLGENAEKYYTMNNLIHIMAKLRNKDGCPWDRKQTHESLKQYLIEEAYEVLEAIEKEDSDLMVEELGDLLLQIVFHARIAEESGHFSMIDVLTGICKKLVYRHPHVFGSYRVNTDTAALQNWEEMKRKEKDEKSHTEGLKRVPKQLPALMRSYKVQGKAADVGFDWHHVEDAIEKIQEELQELLEVYNTSETDKITEELGDLLFAVVNVARFLKVNPELALKGTTEKFIQRFAYIEEMARKNGKNLEDMTLQELDSMWNMAKIHKNKKNDKKY